MNNLHQIWIQGWESTPTKYKQNSLEWKNVNTSWTYNFWDENLIMKLLESYPPSYMKRFISYDRPVMKADFGRIIILHKCGGLYMDMDMRPINPIDSCEKNLSENLENYAYVVKVPPPVGFSKTRNFFSKMMGFSNFTLGGPSGHPLWQDMIDRMMSDDSPGGDISFSHPAKMQDIFEKYYRNGWMKTFEPSSFVACKPYDRKTIASHAYDGNWTNPILSKTFSTSRKIPIDIIFLVIVGILAVVLVSRFVISKNRKITK